MKSFSIRIEFANLPLIFVLQNFVKPLIIAARCIVSIFEYELIY